MMNIIKSFARKGVNFAKKQLFKLTPELLFQVDPAFQLLYNEGIEKTMTPPSGDLIVNKRQARYYNLINIYSLTEAFDGNTAEIGCWKGLSSFMLNKSASLKSEGYSGKNFWVIDSFEGLSEPEFSDQNLEEFVPIDIVPGKGRIAGSFSAGLDNVQKCLSDFPDINYVKGWVPEVLGQVPENMKWKFVHIDLDLYGPIKGAFEYFSARMVPGGIILFDDYGSLYWPGARKAVDEVGAHVGGSLVLLSTGQAFWQAPLGEQSTARSQIC